MQKNKKSNFLKFVKSCTKKVHHKKIRFKLFLSVAAVVLLFLTISTYHSLSHTGALILGTIEKHGESVAMIIANSSIEKVLSWDYPALQLEIDSVGVADEDIIKISVFHDSKQVAKYECVQCVATEDAIEKTAQIQVTISDEVRNLGEVKIFMSKQRYYQFQSSEIQRLMYYGLFLLIGDTIVSYATVAGLLLVPIKKISQGAEIIGKGNLDYRINLDNDDEIGALADTINSMTQNLQRSREVLDEVKNKTSAIVANLLDPIIVVKDQRVILFNPAAEETFHLTKDDLGKKLIHSGNPDCLGDRLCLCDFREIIKPDYLSKVLRFDKEEFPVVEEITLNFDNKKGEMADDQRVIYKVLTSSVRDEQGRYYGHMKVFHDLTRERRVDNLKSKFITIAAHQLRTPLSGIKWSLNMIKNGEMGEINPEVKSYLEETSKANERMINLVDNLLDVAHIEEGHLLQERELMSVQDLMKDIISALKVKSQTSKVDVKLEISNVGVSKIVADQGKIKLAIQNIVDNAIKYSKPGKNVTIELSPVWEGEKEFAEIKIKDAGIGISKEDQKKIFSKFFRSDNAVKAVPEGSGFGLFIAKNVITAHQGKVWFESELGKGTTFFVRIPVAESGQSA